MSDTLDSAGLSAPGPPQEPIRLDELSEGAFAQRFHESTLGDDHQHFWHVLGRNWAEESRWWVEWDGWRTGDAASMAAAEAMERVIVRAVFLNGDRIFANLARWDRNATVMGAMALASRMPGVLAPAEAWNVSPWLLGLPGAKVLALRRGQDEAVVDMAPGHLIDKQAGCAPVWNEAAPAWREFLAHVTGDDEGFEHDILEMLATALVGANPWRRFWVLKGPTATGKSTLLRIAHALAGDYGRAVMSDSFAGRRPGPNHELAHLPGVRLVTSSEFSGAYWDSPVLKALTGGEEVSARDLYKSSFAFTPVCSLVLAVNDIDMPSMRVRDEALMRRMVVMPFERPLAEGRDWPKGDLAGHIIEHELRGVMAEVADWARQLPALELHLSGPVARATRAYADSADSVGQWLTDCGIRQPGARGEGGEALHRDYTEYCTREGWRPLGSRKFAQALDAHGFPAKRSAGANIRPGLGLPLMR